MSTRAPPRYAIARPNGILSVPATTTLGTSRTAIPRLKVVIRRLPPGLTQAEFEEALGEEWKVGGDRVDWAVYKIGKLSTDPVKPTRPARAYLHLTKQEYLGVLSEKVRETNFVVAKASVGDVVLLGPPIVEFAPYGRIPSNKVRKDARQGTIDQDPEFIDFLESLTNPTIKAAPSEPTNDSEVNKAEVMAVTPLIQYLRDKKANKGKEVVLQAKITKHARPESKESKNPQTPDKKTSPKSLKESTPPVDKRSASAIKVEKAARDAVRVLNKQAITAIKNPAVSSVAPTTTTTSLPSSAAPATPAAP
ncbi:MAG: hypothetical protein Q9187_008018, partial [Circinaria calcarea]